MSYVKNAFGQTVWIDPSTGIPTPGDAMPGNSLTYSQNLATGYPINPATGAPMQGQASLTPPTMRRLAQMPGVVFYQTPCAFPTPFMAYNEENTIGRQLRDYTQTWTWDEDNFSTVGTAVPKSIRWDTVGAVYALTAAVYMTPGISIPSSIPSTAEGLLNTFKINIFQPNGNRYIVNAPALGGTIFGLGDRPRWLANSAWPINNGTTIVLEVTPLFEDINVCLALWTLENPGPSNINFYPGQ